MKSFIMKRRYTQRFYTGTTLLSVLLILAGCHQGMTPVKSSAPDKDFTSNTLSLELPESDVADKKRVDETPIQIDTVQYSVRTRVSSIHSNNSYVDKKARAKTTDFYTRNNFQTKWLGEHAPSTLYYTLIDIIKSSARYGLHPDDYPIGAIEERLQSLYADSLHIEEIYDLDVQLTDVFFLLTTHLIEGRITATHNGSRLWIKETVKVDDITLLMDAHDANKLTVTLEKLHPIQEQYTKLQIALERYRELATSMPDDFPAIYATGKIKPHDTHPTIPLIRRKLALTDWKLDSAMINSTFYDDALVSSVKWFQLRHGLEPDGIIGAGTTKFLNQSFKEKAEVIELNLERMRWLPETYGDNYIIVNVPEYKLRVFENQKLGLEMKVIVGAEDKATPIFSDTLKYIVFSPTWSVPISIIRDEIIPRLQKDSTYYSGKNYLFYKNSVEVDPSSVNWKDPLINPNSYNVVQQPGKDNALGMAKFIMPNKMNIYLHDTPNHNLFNKSNRALSHGCVRLDDPDKLAEYLLKDQRGWDKEAINNVMHSEQTQTVFLKKPYHVQIEYRTAWVDDNGLVNFRDDVYGHDKKQLAQLNQTGNRSDKVASK
jgi:murein L,D-transpeptidase YcbB/YkuD